MRHVVLAKEGWLFELWLVLGGVLAAPIFASSVVSMPLLLDRRVSLLQAVLTSWRTVLANPLPLALWAVLIVGFTAAGPGLGVARADRGDAHAGPRQLACLPRPDRPGQPARARDRLAAARHRGAALMFGFTEAQISAFGLSFGLGAFMLYMLFIIGQLAWESKAGKFGTFILFLGLGLGMVGFAAKYVIQWIIEK